MMDEEGRRMKCGVEQEINNANMLQTVPTGKPHDIMDRDVDPRLHLPLSLQNNALAAITTPRDSHNGCKYCSNTLPPTK
jgi:hypothetical protein